MVVRPHRFESRCTCVRFAWSAYLQNVVFHKHLSAILVANLYHLAPSNLQEGTVNAQFNQSTSGARMLRARALRCLSAPFVLSESAAVRPLPQTSIVPTGKCATAALVRTVPVGGTAREHHVQQGMLLVAPDDPSESANNKREPTLSQLAALLQCVKLFSIMHLHSQFLIPWPSGTSSVNLHGASGAVLSRISVLLHYASVNRTETPETG